MLAWWAEVAENANDFAAVLGYDIEMLHCLVCDHKHERQRWIQDRQPMTCVEPSVPPSSARKSRRKLQSRAGDGPKELESSVWQQLGISKIRAGRRNP